jgi:hypothetical protein
VSHNFQTAPAEVEEEPIGELRERLIAGWTRALQNGCAGKGWGTNSSVVQTSDPFVDWVRSVPEDALRRWQKKVQTNPIFKRPFEPYELEAAQNAWTRARTVAIDLIFELANGGSGPANHRVTLEELLASDGYKALDKQTQWACRYIAEHGQQQKPDGTWGLQEPKKS